MASDLEKGSRDEKAAAITRDIIVALAGSLEKPPIDVAQAAQDYGDGLAKVYSILHAAVRETLR